MKACGIEPDGAHMTRRLNGESNSRSPKRDWRKCGTADLRRAGGLCSAAVSILPHYRKKGDHPGRYFDAWIVFEPDSHRSGQSNFIDFWVCNPFPGEVNRLLGCAGRLAFVIK
jgi:hypothetical protein